MSDLVESILIQLNLDKDQTQKALAETTAAIADQKARIKELVAQMADLSKAGQTNTATYKNMQAELATTKTSVQALTKEANTYQLALTKEQQANNAVTGSLVEMRAALAAGQIQYASYSETQKATDAGVIAFGKSLAVLKKQITDQATGIGSTVEKVGDYEGAINKLLPDLTIFGVSLQAVQTKLQGIKDIMAAQKVATEASAAANQAAAAAAVEKAAAESAAAAAAVTQAAADKLAAVSAEEMAAAEEASALAAIQASEASKALAGAEVVMAATTEGASVALRVFRVALISTGIGALIVAVGALIAYFTQTQQGLDFISKSAAAVGAVFKVLVDRASTLGRAIIDAFENPIDTLKALGKFIEENFVNRLKAIPIILEAIGGGFKALVTLDFGALKQSLKDVAQGFVEFSTGLDKKQQDAVAESIGNLGSEMGHAAKSAYELKGQMQALEDAENAYITKKAEEEKKLQELRLAAKQTDDPKQKAKDLQEVLNIETAQVDKEIGFAKTRAQISQQQFDLGKRTREDVKANNELQAKADEIAAEGARRKVRFQQQLNAALGKDDKIRIADEKQNAKDDLTIEEELAKSKIALIKSNRERADAEAQQEYEKRLATIPEHSNKKAELEEAALQALHDKLKANKEKFDEEDLKREEEIATKRLEGDKQFITEADKLAVKYAQNKAEKLAAELKQVNDNAQLELAALEINADKEKEVKINGVSKTGEEVAAIDAVYTQRKIDVLKQTSTIIAQIVEQEKIKELQDEQEFEALRAAGQKRLSDEETNAKLKALKAKYAEEKRLLTQKYSDEHGLTERGLKAIELLDAKYHKAELDVQRITEDEKLKIISTSIGEAAKLFSQNTAAYIILATAQAIINTYLGATNAIATYAPPYGEIAAAGVIIAGLADVAKINQVQFYEGGHYSKDGGHTGSGDPRRESLGVGRKPYAYHKEEYIVPHQVLRHPLGKELVSTLERMRVSNTSPAYTGGLRGYAEGGATPDFTFVTQQASQPVVDQYAMENMLIKAAALIPPPVLTVEDYNVASTRVSVVASRANI